PPHARERRVRKTQPAVAAEYGHRLGEVVERLALHADQSIVAAFEIEPLGDIVEEVNHAPFRVGRGDTPHSASVREMPHMLLGLDRAVGIVERTLPLAEVLLVRKLAGRAQSVEYD